MVRFYRLTASKGICAFKMHRQHSATLHLVVGFCRFCKDNSAHFLFYFERFALFTLCSAFVDDNCKEFIFLQLFD